MKKKFGIPRKCEVCGQPFMAPTLTSRYCSPQCSRKAYAIRKKEDKEQMKLYELAKKIPESRIYVSVSEANALFGISTDTVYRLIRRGMISHFNSGQRQTRVSKEDLMKLYPLRESPLEKKEKVLPKLYSLEPENCYTIGEIAKKFHLDESTVYLHIRKYSIPTRQIGNYVYVPMKEIDNLYK